MLYLMHCSTDGDDDGGENSGTFTFLVDAPDLAVARDRLRAAVHKGREPAGPGGGPLFGGPLDVFLDDVIEVGELPAAGLIGRYQVLGGDVSCSLPGGEPGCVAHHFGDEEEPGDRADPVLVPFLSFGRGGPG